MDYTYYAIIEEDEDGFTIDFPAFDGQLYTDGSTMTEASKNASDVLRLMLAEYIYAGMTLPSTGDMDGCNAVFTVEVTDDFITETQCMSFSQAAEELGVSKGRISQMVKSGQLELFEHRGKRMVTIASVNARQNQQPKAGRPRKVGNQ